MKNTKHKKKHNVQTKKISVQKQIKVQDNIVLRTTRNLITVKNLASDLQQNLSYHSAIIYKTLIIVFGG